jgi:hypothetical protein
MLKVVPFFVSTRRQIFPPLVFGYYRGFFVCEILMPRANQIGNMVGNIPAY